MINILSDCVSKKKKTSPTGLWLVVAILCVHCDIVAFDGAEARSVDQKSVMEEDSK